MDKARLIQRLMATFVAELEEHVRALERDLLALEKGAAGEERRRRFDVLFRTAHSVKGAAGAVGVGPVEAAAHLTEEVLSAARDGGLPTDAAFFAALLPVVDAIGDAGRRLRDGRDLAGGPLDGALRGLAALVGDHGRHQAPLPRPPILPVPVPPVPVPPAPMAAAEPAANASDPAIVPASSAGGWSGMVRVPAEKLDALMAQSGELLLVRHRAEARQQDALALLDQIGAWQAEWRRLEFGLTTLLKRDGQGGAAALRAQIDRTIGRHRDAVWRLERGMQRLTADLQGDRRLLDQVAGPIDQEIRRARMLPFAEVCEGLDRAVRDLAAAGGRQIELVVRGHDIELDRSLLEGLKDSLLHLVRNAVDHGIEPAGQRAAAGKPPLARIVVSARRNAARVEVQIADDGRGLDLDAIRSRLVQGGLPVPEDPAALARAIFAPGFSTAAVVTALSGRGVGLDVVKTAVEAMRGTVDVDFVAGRGSRFVLSLPLTLTSVRAVLAGVGGTVFAIEADQVLRVIRPALADLVAVEGRDMLVIDRRPVPVVRLVDLLGMTEPAAPPAARLIAIVLDIRGRRVAIVVDDVRAEREIVIRSLGRRLRRITHVGAATILPDGRIGLVLNAAELVDRAQAMAGGTRLAAGDAAAGTGRRPRRLLVVDDSVTIRTLIKSILEGAGYDVLAAPDGAEAWTMLLEQGADLVVSDVEMPRMDGFTLTETIRASPRFRKLPVILVTAMESEADRARGLAAGADAYQVKSGFDQSALLAAIGRLL